MGRPARPDAKGHKNIGNAESQITSFTLLQANKRGTRSGCLFQYYQSTFLQANDLN